MAKKHAGRSAAAQPSQGRKMTFDDFDQGQVIESFEHPPVIHKIDEDNDDDDDDDDDDAPETVGTSSGKQAALLAEREAELTKRAAREAAKLRNAKIAEAKRSQEKGKGLEQGKKGKINLDMGKRKRKIEVEEEEEEEEDEETKRLRKRMEAAMEDGEGDSFDEMNEDEKEEDDDDDQDEEEESGDDDDDDEHESFHTTSDQEGDLDDLDEDRDEDDDDDEELREDGPVTAETLRLRARMDAMMAAMEARAQGTSKSTSTSISSSISNPTSASKLTSITSMSRGLDGDEEDYSQWDLEVGIGGIGGAQPLSNAAIAKAEEERRRLKSVKKKNKEDVKKMKEMKRKKKRRIEVEEEVSRKVGPKTTLQILPSTLTSSSSTSFSPDGLPPVLGPRQKINNSQRNVSAKNFYKRAMKQSGMIPGRGLVNGRLPNPSTKKRK